MADAHIKAVITAEDRASKEIESFGSKVSHVGRNIAVVAAAAGTALVGLGVTSIKAFSAQEDATARLQAGINNVRSASDKSIKSLQDQASALQKITRFSDEQILSGQAMLTTFQLNQKTIEKLTPSMLNMAEGMRKSTGQTQDLEQLGIMFGKVMGGAEEGIEGLSTALRKNGVQMTEAQAEIFRTGTEAERAAALVAIMDYNFGGFAEAGGKTFSGRLDIMKNQLGELQESLGATLADKLIPFIDKITVWVQTHPGEIENAINKFVAMVNFIGTVFGAIGTALGWLVDATAKVILHFWMVYDQAIQFGRQLVLLFEVSLNAIYQLFVGLPIKIMGVLWGFIGTIGGWFQHLGAVTAGWASGVVNGIVGYFTRLPGMILDAIGDVGSFIKNKIGDMDIPGPLGKVRDTIPGFAGGVQNFSGGAAVVGEQGPELVNLPRGSDVIPNSQLGGSVNITIQAGAFMGNKVEARRFAQDIWNNLQDLNRSKGIV